MPSTPTSSPRSSTLLTISPYAVVSTQPLALLGKGILDYVMLLFDYFLFVRYTAVCYPYKYREKNANAKLLQSVFKFLVPIVIFSVIINIPRFYETVIVTTTANITIGHNVTITEETVTYDVTPLRMDPDYIW